MEGSVESIDHERNDDDELGQRHYHKPAGLESKL